MFKLYRMCPRHLRQLKRLSFIKRVMHPKSRKYIKIASLSICVMTTGSFIAACAHHVHILPSCFKSIEPIIVDVIGYGMHGLGLIPIAKYVEPLWAILTGLD